MNYQSANEGVDRFPIPSVFTSVRSLNEMYRTQNPTNIAEYKAKGLKAPDFGEYDINNNVVALCDNEGNIYCALGDARPGRNAEILAALKPLENEGRITKGNFYVPFFGAYNQDKNSSLS